VIHKITRYDLVDLNEGTQEPEAWDMAPAKHGVYVEYDDHKRIVDALNAEIKRLKTGGVQ
jgi:hypothetical protein